MKKKDKQDYPIRLLSDDELDWAYTDGKYTERCIGYLRGFFNHCGAESIHTWFPLHDEWNTRDFKAALDDYGEWLRETGILGSYSSMAEYCSEYTETTTKFIVGPSFCFITELKGYTFCLRCTCCPGDYHFRIRCYINGEVDGDGTD